MPASALSQENACYPVRFAILVFLLVLSVTAGKAMANGWEHGAIPLTALIAGLDSEHDETRQRAARSLGFRGQAEATGPLLARLSRERQPRVRSSIYLSLGALKAPAALPALQRCLHTETYPEVRAACADAMGKSGLAGAAGTVRDILPHEVNALVRSRLIAAMGSFHDDATIALLSALLRRKGFRGERPRIIRALGRSGSPRAVPPLLEALKKARGFAEKRALVQALARLAAPEAAAPLIRLLASTRRPALKHDLITAIAATRAGSILPVLVRQLDASEPPLQKAAITGLGTLADRRAIPDLIRFCLSVSTGITPRSLRQAAMYQEPFDTMRSRLDLLRTGLRVLLNLDPGAATEAFMPAAVLRIDTPNSAGLVVLADELYQIRRIALRGLGYARSQRHKVGAILTGALADQDPRLRAVAARAIGVLGGPQAAARLQPLLGDRDADVRRVAARTLGLLKSPEAAAAMTPLLGDPGRFVRRAAATALGRLGAAGAIPALKKALDREKDSGTRAAIAFSLKLLSGK